MTRKKSAEDLDVKSSANKTSKKKPSTKSPEPAKNKKKRVVQPEPEISGDYIEKTDKPKDRNKHETQVVAKGSYVLSPGGRGGAAKSVKTILTELAKAEAALAGILPHQFLLAIVRGEPITQRYTVDIRDENGVVVEQHIYEKDVYPSMEARTEAAKAAAPYYAPRLATQVVTLNNPNQMSHLTDEQIDHELKTVGTMLAAAEGK